MPEGWTQRIYSNLLAHAKCEKVNWNIFQEYISIYFSTHSEKYFWNVFIEFGTLFLNSHGSTDLTLCGLMRPYGDKDLGQHWLR